MYWGMELAGLTGLEPATSDVTGRRSNQLNYNPARGGTAGFVMAASAVTWMREPNDLYRS
jgi:hypothetical protein